MTFRFKFIKKNQKIICGKFNKKMTFGKKMIIIYYGRFFLRFFAFIVIFNVFNTLHI